MIKTYSLLHIGAFHTNHCEDFYTIAPISKNEQVIAVMDGCSMGTESVFASTLFGKLLRKICRELYYDDFIAPKKTCLKDQLRTIALRMFTELKNLKNTLGLDTSELLSTLVLVVVDMDIRSVAGMVMGDGLICVDGTLISFDQNDRPDYPAYHLGKTADAWYADQNQFITVSSFNDLSISTDGIFSFRPHTRATKARGFEEITRFLMYDRVDIEQNNLLMRKLRFINRVYQMAPTDDLAMIRLINDTL